MMRVPQGMRALRAWAQRCCVRTALAWRLKAALAEGSRAEAAIEPREAELRRALAVIRAAALQTSAEAAAAAVAAQRWQRKALGALRASAHAAAAAAVRRGAAAALHRHRGLDAALRGWATRWGPDTTNSVKTLRELEEDERVREVSLFLFPCGQLV